MLDRAVRADGSIAPLVDGTWRLQLALRGPGVADTRTIEAADCSALGDVAALLLASLDADGVGR